MTLFLLSSLLPDEFGLLRQDLEGEADRCLLGVKDYELSEALPLWSSAQYPLFASDGGEFE